MLNIIEQYSGNQAILAILAFVIAILFSLTLHEFAHAFVAHKQGDLTPKAYGRLTLNPMAHVDQLGMVMLFLLGFGWAKPVPVNPLKFKHYRKGFFMVSVAGIIVNIVLHIAFTALFVAILLGKIAIDVQSSFGFFTFLLVNYLMIINLYLALFNLIPIAPLDGFNMLTTFTKHDNAVLRFLRQNGTIILLVLLISGILERVLVYLYNLINEPIFSLFLRLIAGGAV